MWNSDGNGNINIWNCDELNNDVGKLICVMKIKNLNEFKKYICMKIYLKNFFEIILYIKN